MREIVEWAFSIHGEQYDGYYSPEDALAGMERMMAKGYSQNEILGPYPIYAEYQ